jgi:putative spermidine/putrescine transport system permease protein
MKLTRTQILLLLGGPLLLLFAFFVLPLGLMFMQSAWRLESGLSPQQYGRVLGDGYYWGVLLLTFRLGLLTTLLCFVTGYPLAYAITFHIHRRWARRLVYLILVTPLFTSNIVRAFGWLVVLGRRGMVNQTLLATGLIDRPLSLVYSEFSIVLALSYTLVPFMVLSISSTLQNLSRSLLEASRDLGASATMTFLKVTLPLSLPGVIAGSLIVFTLAVSAYVTPSIMGGGRRMVMSMLIYQQYLVTFDANLGAALAVILLVITLALITAYTLVLERGRRRSH